MNSRDQKAQRPPQRLHLQKANPSPTEKINGILHLPPFSEEKANLGALKSMSSLPPSTA